MRSSVTYNSLLHDEQMINVKVPVHQKRIKTTVEEKQNFPRLIPEQKTVNSKTTC